jgi:hypothetical protein
MPLHFGKIFALIALLTIVAFVLWQLWIAVFAGETVEKRTGLNLLVAPTASAVLAG